VNDYSDIERQLEEDLATAAALISGADVVALACHVAPDGDALGSMLALHHVLRASGRNSVAAFAGTQVTGPHYRELPGLDLLSDPVDYPAEPDVMVTLDCGSMGRLGDLAINAKAAKELIVVDHHLSNTRYGSIHLVDPKAAASAVVVARLIDHLGLPLTEEAAVCLYAGLVCDTGRLNRVLFEEHRLAYLRLVGNVLSRAEMVEEKGFIWAAISAADLGDFDVTLEETEGLIDFLRQAKEAEVACVLKEVDGHVRGSLRSLGEVDVSSVAALFGGGGHRYAAGFTTTEPVPQVVETIIRAL
jgi:bifunctional oligoribonuclease and PAP phosphatase NrnA